MNRPTGDRPEDQLERLLASGATDFERRVLESALQKKPSSASSARMAKALGVTAATIGSATAATTLAAGATATKGVAAAGATAWPWVTLGVIGLAVAGAVVGTRTGHEARPPQTVPSVMAPVMQAPEPVAPTEPAVAEPSPRATTPTQRAHTTTATSELRDQVALLDSAREAVSAGAGRRALEILRRYQDRYPTGSFRPEAAAMKIEALLKLGREAEAHALAAQFVAEHRGSLLSRRVAEIAGLPQP
jgi:hypothetical protein